MEVYVYRPMDQMSRAPDLADIQAVARSPSTERNSTIAPAIA